MASEGNKERTFLMLKPDSVKRGICFEILQRFEKRGYKLVAMKMVQTTEEMLSQHYAELKDKPFFPGMIKYMKNKPVIPTVWEGKDVVKQARSMLGETNPLASKPGSIRGDFSIDLGRNVIHGSDSVDTAKKEIALWFKPEELVDYDLAAKDWIYE